MRKFKKILPLALVLAAALNITSAYAISIASRGGFVMNANTCEELYGYNADTLMVPASMTKVMSLYVIYDAMAQGRVAKDTQIPVGSSLAAFSRDPGYSNVCLSAGATYSLDELLGAIVVVSANAAVMAVGDYLYGSEANFVARMNEFVGTWGLDAYFADSTGVSARNKITPRSMATLANRLVTDYPDILNYTTRTSINFRGTTYYATNKMLPGRDYDYEGTQGLKTGTTSAAGACFTGTVVRNGVRMISVIMGAPATNTRYTDSITMLDYAFSKAEAQPEPQVSAPEPTAAPEPDKPYVSIVGSWTGPAAVSTTQPSARPAIVPNATASPAPVSTPSATPAPSPEPISEPVPKPTPVPMPDSVPEEEIPVQQTGGTQIFINDTPIPAYRHESQDMDLILVEDLRGNGFEVDYDPAGNTLTVINNPAALLTGHAADAFPEDNIIRDVKPVNVLLKGSADDLGIYTGLVYDYNGRAAIDVQEMAYIGWVLKNSDTQKVIVVTR